jgi:pSer/pThr/pTyr-binding forkhead associated (FHA) protein
MLLEGANVIGRAPDSTIRCDAAGVSRYHARILVSKGVATLEDLGSKNGTYLQGQRITSAYLSHGDEIRLGHASLTFRIEPPLGPTETVPIDAGPHGRVPEP